MRRWLTSAPAALVLALWLIAGCSSDSEPSVDAPAPAPRLPEGEAGALLGRAIEAAGGWRRWTLVRDVSFISTQTIVDPGRQVTSDSIGWFMAPLHDGARARMDSIGLPTEVRFGIDAAETWIVSDGRAVTARGQLALTRFDMVSNLFWFSLPFLLAEQPVELSAPGEVRGPSGERWQRLRAEFETPNPAVPGPWVVLYIDADTGLIDHVHSHLTAPFLRHELWVGRWLDYRDCGGFTKERQRQFFPADAEGAIVGAMVTEQFLEHVRFNNGYAAAHFARPRAKEKPEAAGERQPAGGAPVREIHVERGDLARGASEAVFVPHAGLRARSPGGHAGPRYQTVAWGF